MPTAIADNLADLKQLLTGEKTYLKVPKEGEVVRGTVVATSPREVLVDITGFKSGIVRGLEIKELEQIYPGLKIGDVIEATVLELENEEGQVELSFRFAGETRAWETAFAAKHKQEIVKAHIDDANRGGLMVSWMGLKGFLPVSQLSPEHYPRVPGGDKAKILEKLRTFVGGDFRAQILDCDPKSGKLIFSEKALWEDEQKDLLAKYKIGDTVEGTITAVADFGVFVKFSGEGGDGLEGLVHISEIAWQRIDDPADVVKVGQKVRAQILNIQGSKIFLSLKALQDDPWKRIQERYSVGQVVDGKILKVNPFGLFVELDAEIHGLAHVSELAVKPNVPLEEQIQPSQVRKFKIVSIEPEHHRLGLSEKALQSGAELAVPQESAGEATGVLEEKHDTMPNDETRMTNQAPIQNSGTATEEIEH